MVWAICLALALLASSGKTKACTVDLIEFNHAVLAEHSNFEQVIFWDWNHEYCRYDARGYAMLDQVLVIDSKRVIVKGWQVTGRSSLVSKTDHDPEREHLKLLPGVYRIKMPWE
jgi:hypothetical protein